MGGRKFPPERGCAYMVGRLAALMRRNQKGFTLVELMVVVLIIGILVAIAIPLYTKSQANAQINACKANLRTIDGAIAQYLADNPNATSIDLDNNLVNEGYLKAKPTCPAGGTYSVEKETTSGRFYAKCSKGHTYP